MPSERQLPEWFAVGRVGQQPEVGEEGKDVRAVGDDRRRGTMIQRVLCFPFRGPHRPPPQQLAVCTLEAQRDQLVAFRAGDEDAIARKHGRRLALRQFGAPEDIAIGPELNGEACAREAQTRAVGAAELRPLRRSADKGECADRPVHGQPTIITAARSRLMKIKFCVRETRQNYASPGKFVGAGCPSAFHCGKEMRQLCAGGVER
jgi:hypothetical protein